MQKSQPNVIRDASLKHLGFGLLRFWNSDVLKHTQGAPKVILSTLEESPSPGVLRAPPSPTAGERGKQAKS